MKSKIYREFKNYGKLRGLEDGNGVGKRLQMTPVPGETSANRVQERNWVKEKAEAVASALRFTPTGLHPWLANILFYNFTNILRASASPREVYPDGIVCVWYKEKAEAVASALRFIPGNSRSRFANYLRFRQYISRTAPRTNSAQVDGSGTALELMLTQNILPS